MKYFVFFDAYGHSRKVISEKELAEAYHHDPEVFRRAVGSTEAKNELGSAAGTVGVLNFDSEKELNDYLQALGDEVEGFFNCADGSRPYNF